MQMSGVRSRACLCSIPHKITMYEMLHQVAWRGCLPPLLTRLGPSQSGATGGVRGPSEARASWKLKSPYETAWWV